MSRASQVDETVRDLVPVGDAEAAVGGKGALRRAGQEEGLQGRVGFEPTTSRLKVGRSTAELTAPKATPPRAAERIVTAATCSSRRPRRRAGHRLTRRTGSPSWSSGPPGPSAGRFPATEPSGR